MYNAAHQIPTSVMEDLVLSVCEMFRFLADRRLVNRRHLHIVVLSPDYDPVQPIKLGILYETSIGDRDSWEWPYDQYARDKAREALARQCSTSEAGNNPLRLRSGDVLLTGGFYLDGLAIGVSGVQGEFDEAFSATIAFLIRAVVKLIIKKHNEADADYLGQIKTTDADLRCA